MNNIPIDRFCLSLCVKTLTLDNGGYQLRVIKHTEGKKCAIEHYYVIFIPCRHMDVNNLKSIEISKIS